LPFRAGFGEPVCIKGGPHGHLRDEYGNYNGDNFRDGGEILLSGPLDLALSRFRHAPLLTQISVIGGLAAIAQSLLLAGIGIMLWSRKSRGFLCGGGLLALGLGLWAFTFYFITLS
jgi:hypothetical protein